MRLYAYAGRFLWEFRTVGMDDVNKEIIRNLAANDMGGFVDALFVARDGSVTEGTYCRIQNLVSDIEDHVTTHGALISVLISQVGKPVSGDAIRAGEQWYRVNLRRPGTDTSLVAVECQLLDFDELNQDQQAALSAL